MLSINSIMHVFSFLCLAGLLFAVARQRSNLQFLSRHISGLGNYDSKAMLVKTVAPPAKYFTKFCKLFAIEGDIDLNRSAIKLAQINVAALMQLHSAHHIVHIKLRENTSGSERDATLTLTIEKPISPDETFLKGQSISQWVVSSPPTNTLIVPKPSKESI